MQTLVNGILNGLVLGLLAQAFTLVYLPTRVLFFAAAGIYALAPYLQMQFTRWEILTPVSIALTLSCGVCLSMLFEIFNHRDKRGQTRVLDLQREEF